MNHTKLKPPESTQSLLIENLRIAAKEMGKYCPDRKELRVSKGGEVYHFTCGKSEIRFASTARPEVVIPLSDDATVSELKRFIAHAIDSPELYVI